MRALGKTLHRRLLTITFILCTVGWGQSLYAASPSSSEDERDAVELLRQSVKCPLSVQQIKKWGGVATYTGDAHAYRVDLKYFYNVKSEYAYPTGDEPQ